MLFDPAVYFGDREADLAMTRLLVAFGASFYCGVSGRVAAWMRALGGASPALQPVPRAESFQFVRRRLSAQALDMIQRLLA